MARNLLKFGALEAKRTVFLLCDVQESFRRHMKHFDGVVNVASKMLEAAKHFNIPVYVSEHNSEALGPTTKDINLDGAFVYDKHIFSMYNQEFKERLRSDMPDLESVVIFGVATHLCIELTIIDLIFHENVNIHVLADGVSSRTLMDRSLALQRFQSMGCFVGTSENVLLKLLKDKNHPAFKPISKLISKPAPDKFGAAS